MTVEQPNDATLEAPTPDDSETADTPATSDDSDVDEGAPSTGYVAVCDGAGIDYIDIDSATVVYREDLPALEINEADDGATDAEGNVGNFEPTIPYNTWNKPCDFSFDGGLSQIAGLDTYATGDAVPAIMDLTNGEVTDLVDPVDHGGFSRTKSIEYAAAAFAPNSTDVWSVRAVGSDGPDDHYALVDPTGSTVEKYVCRSCYGHEAPQLVFGVRSTAPVVIADGDLDPRQKLPSDLLYLDSSLLPDTNLSIGSIRVSDDGAMAAFTATGSSSDDEGVMRVYTVSSKGGDPTLLTTLDINDNRGFRGEVVRYVP